jgi:hypothetical protein
MKALFIKGSREGATVDANPKRVAYWQRVGIAKNAEGEVKLKKEATKAPKKSVKKKSVKKIAKKKGG